MKPEPESTARFRLRALLALPLLLAGFGCARDTGVVSLGPNVYSITASHAPVRGGHISAQRDAMRQASEHCARQGGQVVAHQRGIAGAEWNPFGNTDFALTFSCSREAPRSDPAI
jgi:hypothetical protein